MYKKNTHKSQTALGLLLAVILMALPILQSPDAFAEDITILNDGATHMEAPETAPTLDPSVPPSPDTAVDNATPAPSAPPTASPATENTGVPTDAPQATPAESMPPALVEEPPVPEDAAPELMDSFEPETTPEGWARTDDEPMDVRDVLSAMDVSPASMINRFSVQFIEDGQVVASPTENAGVRMTFHIHLPEGVPAQLREGDRYEINRPDTIVATGAHDIDLVADDVVIGHVYVNDGPLQVTFYNAVQSFSAIETNFSIDAAFVPGVYAPGSHGVFSLPGEDAVSLRFTMAIENGTRIGDPENTPVLEYAACDGNCISGEGLVTGFALSYRDNAGMETDTPTVDAAISATMTLVLPGRTTQHFSTKRTYQIALPQALIIPEVQIQAVETEMGTLATAQIGPGDDIMITFVEGAEAMIGQPATFTFNAAFDVGIVTMAGEYILTVPNEALSPVMKVTIVDRPSPTATPAPTEAIAFALEELAIGDIDAPQIAEGETFALHLPVVFAYDEGLWHSNSDENGNLLPYAPANEYDQRFAEMIRELQLSVSDTQADNCPLSEESRSASAYVIKDGKNEGYAALDALQARAEATAGMYPVQFDISWKLADGTNGKMTTSIDIDLLATQGEVDLGTYETPVGQIGAPMVMAIPIAYTRNDGVSYESNEGTDGQTIAYGEGNSFDQAIAEELSEVTLQIAAVQEADFPLDQTTLSGSKAVLANGVNEGYAVFDSATARGDAAPGTYSVNVELAWRNANGQSESKIVPFSIELTGAIGYADGVIVFTYQELKNALNGTMTDSLGQPYDTIYLGYCDVVTEPGETVNNGVIQLGTTGATVPRSVTIVGTDPRNGRRVKLVDVTSSAITDTIRASTAGITLTLQDADVQGNNYYGILHSSVDGVTLNFNNVNYTGRQMAYNRGAGGLVNIRDCNIRIQYSSAASQEVAEACEVRLSGNVQIDKVDSESTAFSLFWLTGSPNKLTVEPGATVTANTVNYFTYNSANSSTIIDIQGTLSVTSGSGNTGCFTYADQWLNSLTVGSGGSLTLTHNGTAYESLRTNNLTVDGTFIIDRASASTRYCIAAVGVGTWNFNNPSYARMNNPGGRLMSGVAGTTANINTQAATLWKSGAANQYIWNNNDMRPYTVTLSGATPSVSIVDLDNGRGAALPAYAPMLNATNFSVRNATQLVFGRYELTINEESVYRGSTQITGSFSRGVAPVIHEYALDAPNGNITTRVQLQFSSGSGSYAATMNPGLESTSLTRVYALAEDGFLEVQVYRDPKSIVELVSVPTEIDFGMVQVPSTSIIVPRGSGSDNMEVVVLDTRDTGSWTLELQATTPLTQSGSNDVLNDALVFVTGGGATINSLLSPLVIHQQTTSTTMPVQTALSWVDAEGILLQLQPLEGLPGDPYTGAMTWTLTVAP